MTDLSSVMPFLTGPAAAQAIEPIVKPSWQSILELLPGLLWVALAIGLVLYFIRELKRLLWSVVLRLKSGSAVKLGPIELGALSAIPKALPERVGESPFWKNKQVKKDNGTLGGLREWYASYSNYAMLVHRVFPSDKPDQEYDVLLYFVEREEGALLGVSKVEYYFGPYWGDYIYPSEDRLRGFPIKVSAFDRFICIAKLHFNDTKKTAIVFRYIDFEMGAYPTVPTALAKQAGTQDLPHGGEPIEKVVEDRFHLP
jgi:hypothetical protein